jgi:hypothetical protein
MGDRTGAAHTPVPNPGDPGWLHTHTHEPNPAPPSPDPTLFLRLPDRSEIALTPADLDNLPVVVVADCFVVSTGHGASGPFAFGGVRLADLIAAYWSSPWRYADVSSADGFGNRVLAEEAQSQTRPILLATTLDGAPMTRAQGLVRLIVPSETDDALRQVKWVAHIEVH